MDTPPRLPASETRVSELRKTRSNTSTEYSSSDVTMTTHEEMRSAVRSLKQEVARLQTAHTRSRERLFSAIMLSLKLSIAELQHNTTPAQEVFEELMAADLPEQYWTAWIQTRLEGSATLSFPSVSASILNQTLG